MQASCKLHLKSETTGADILAYSQCNITCDDKKYTRLSDLRGLLSRTAEQGGLEF
jgi:hypothetical protein